MFDQGEHAQTLQCIKEERELTEVHDYYGSEDAYD